VCHGWLAQPCLGYICAIQHGWASQPWHISGSPEPGLNYYDTNASSPALPAGNILLMIGNMP